MRNQHSLRPQDILVLLKLVASRGKAWRQVDLAQELGLSQYEISVSLERAKASGFLDESKQRINVSALREFLIHGLKYVYPVKPGPVVGGLPTSHSAAPIKGQIVSDANDQYVWPHSEGTMRGQAIEPLYESAPEAAKRDPLLHELLALIDALRVGRARERAIATKELERRLNAR